MFVIALEEKATWVFYKSKRKSLCCLHLPPTAMQL